MGQRALLRVLRTKERTFNTPDREASWGRIDNTVVEPLFQK